MRPVNSWTTFWTTWTSLCWAPFELARVGELVCLISIGYHKKWSCKTHTPLCLQLKAIPTREILTTRTTSTTWLVSPWNPWLLLETLTVSRMHSLIASWAPHPTVSTISLTPALHSSGSRAIYHRLIYFPTGGVFAFSGMCSPESGSCESDPEFSYPSKF